MRRGRAARCRCRTPVVDPSSPPCWGRRLAQPGLHLPREISSSLRHALCGFLPARGGRARPQCLSSLPAPCAAGTGSGTSPGKRVSLEGRSGPDGFLQTDRYARLRETDTWNKGRVKTKTSLGSDLDLTCRPTWCRA